MQKIVDIDNSSHVDSASLTFHLPCGCRFTFRTTSRQTLQQGLLLDPHPASKVSMDSSSRIHDFHPEWVEVSLSRPVSVSQWFYSVVIASIVCCLIGSFVQSFIVQFICLLCLFIGIFLRLKGVLVETSLLVCADFGLQTRNRFFTGHQSTGSFIPMNRLRGVHLIEQLTPVTIQSYIAAELSCDYSPVKPITTDLPDSLLHEGRVLLPLLPSCITANQLNFVNRLCVPLPTLVFVLRLVSAVCDLPYNPHSPPTQ